MHRFATLQEFFEKRNFDVHLVHDKTNHDPSPKCKCRPKQKHQDPCSRRWIWVHSDVKQEDRWATDEAKRLSNIQSEKNRRYIIRQTQEAEKIFERLEVGKHGF